MATKTASTKTSWQTASSTLPVNQVQSSLFVKRLVAMSISHIVYLRGLLPEEAFMDREMEGVPVKIIYEKSNFAPAIQIVEWIKGAFEAFDKKYLERLEFIFFVEGSDKPQILESYSFTFSYGEGQVSVTCGTANEKEQVTKFKLEEIRLATVQLLRHTTMLMHNMRKVAENLLMKVRLYYYDEVTPDDYEPPGFEKAPNFEYTFEPSNVKLRHGKVDTQFHSIKLSSRIGLSRFREENELTEDVRSIVDKHQKEKNNNTNSEIEPMDCIPSSQPVPEGEGPIVTRSTSQKNKRKDISSEYETISQEDSYTFVKETPTDVQNASVHCACGVPKDEGLLIFCDICRHWNHAICYRFIDEKTLPSKFCCIFCHNSTPEAQCNDKSLINLSERDRKMICLYRRALAFCLSCWRVDQKILATELSVSSETADDLLSQMEADKVFSQRKRGKGPYHQINLSYLKGEVVPAYFDKALIKLPSLSKSSLHDKRIENDENECPIKKKIPKINQSINTARMPLRK